MRAPSFEWDENKNQENIAKNGVSFHEAQRAFTDEQRLIVEDLDHSDTKERWFCFGKVEDHIMTVRFTYRDGKIRIYGAGYWRKGRQVYEEKNEEKNKVHR